MGTTSTILNMPLLNLFSSTYGTYPVVIKVYDCSRHLVRGGKKDTEYIAKIFLPEMESLYLEKNRFDIFIVDGASNVEGEGGVVEAVFTWVHTIHGEAHVLDLFFEYIEKIPGIKVNEPCDTS